MQTDFDFGTALDPARSVVIEACAGSGKTWLLVSRVVRLLLAGVPPADILAITFTRKAAQEMEERLRDWLEILATKPDDEALAFLQERALTPAASRELLPRARGLLETYLTAQPGITLNTFHGWFLQLLQRAPLDSGMGGPVQLAERSSGLLEEAWQLFAEGLQRTPESAAALALNELFSDHGLANTQSLLANFVARRAEWWALTSGQEEAVDYALEHLRAELAIDPEQDVVAELFALDALPGDLQSYLGLLEMNSDTDRKLAARLAAAIAPVGAASRPRSSESRGLEAAPTGNTPDTAGCFNEICAVLFTANGQGTPRARKPSGAQAKRLGPGNEERLLDLHAVLCARFDGARQGLAAQAAYRFNRAALCCGAALLDAFQRLKGERQAVDFTDVEWRVHQLLNASEHAEYLQYKLDSRYRHILLDEFQDTNPLQWQILESWLAASGAAGDPPTVFLVGDPKQSIYRFRRAEPRLFDLAADFLEREYQAARLEQNLSRRCAPAVLDAVNKVFAAEPDYPSFHPHQAQQYDLAGEVAVLPLASAGEAPQAAERAGLRNPLVEPLSEIDDRRYENEAGLLAQHIQAMTGHWIISGRDGNLRPLEYRDIMLLVRRRSKLEAYEKALKAARIPFVSTRRGGLLDTLECSDLTALLEFLVAPFADLKLAQVLRSPIFGCDDAALTHLAESGEGSWWQRLALLGEDAPPCLAYARERLLRWQKLADVLPIHDLLDRLYFEGSLPQRYARAVPEALRSAVDANLTAFVELALAVDGGRYPSLSGFLKQIGELRRASDQESPNEGLIAPDNAEDRDGGVNTVRIHTVHEAKGLEAPLVWLLDSHAAPLPECGYGVVLDWPPDSRAPRHFSLAPSGSGIAEAQRAVLEREKTIAARENLNLLYVAMTRAKQ
ncbi:MAG: UvrD-helicase domain-containing protein, partial [Sulfuricellaceae bacterium]|nr:UvrD-helicase domain-containing protein [Sulfuricellaceae bacterium]